MDQVIGFIVGNPISSTFVGLVIGALSASLMNVIWDFYKINDALRKNSKGLGYYLGSKVRKYSISHIKDKALKDKVIRSLDESGEQFDDGWDLGIRGLSISYIGPLLALLIISVCFFSPGSVNAIGGADHKQVLIGVTSTVVTLNTGMPGSYAYPEVYNLSGTDKILYNWKNVSASATGANGETPVPPGAGYTLPYPLGADASGIITFQAIVESGGSAASSNQFVITW